jgi:rhodanese-related sulfurtransferase
MSKTINTEQLRSLLQSKSSCLVLDVLPKVAFDKDHIEGAQNVPMDSPNFLRDVERLAGTKSKKIVVYCASDACGTSGDAAKKLTAAGHSDVVKYEGGIAAWRAQESGTKEPVAASKPSATKHEQAGATEPKDSKDKEHKAPAKGKTAVN